MGRRHKKGNNKSQLPTLGRDEVYMTVGLNIIGILNILNSEKNIFLTPIPYTGESYIGKPSYLFQSQFYSHYINPAEGHFVTLFKINPHRYYCNYNVSHLYELIWNMRKNVTDLIKYIDDMYADYKLIDSLGNILYDVPYIYRYENLYREIKYNIGFTTQDQINIFKTILKYQKPSFSPIITNILYDDVFSAVLPEFIDRIPPEEFQKLNALDIAKVDLQKITSIREHILETTIDVNLLKFLINRGVNPNYVYKYNGVIRLFVVFLFENLSGWKSDQYDELIQLLMDSAEKLVSNNESRDKLHKCLEMISFTDKIKRYVDVYHRDYKKLLDIFKFVVKLGLPLYHNDCSFDIHYLTYILPDDTIHSSGFISRSDQNSSYTNGDVGSIEYQNLIKYIIDNTPKWSMFEDPNSYDPGNSLNLSCANIYPIIGNHVLKMKYPILNVVELKSNITKSFNEIESIVHALQEKHYEIECLKASPYPGEDFIRSNRELYGLNTKEKIKEFIESYTEILEKKLTGELDKNST